MALQSKNALMALVVRGWKPMVTHIKNWMDSYWHKEELIPITKIEGLAQILNAIPSQQTINNLLNSLKPDTIVLVTDGYYTPPATSMVISVLIFSESAQTLSIGLTPNGTEIIGQEEVPAGQYHVITMQVYSEDGNRRLYFSGITAPTTLKIFKQ